MNKIVPFDCAGIMNKKNAGQISYTTYGDYVMIDLTFHDGLINPNWKYDMLYIMISLPKEIVPDNIRKFTEYGVSIENGSRKLFQIDWTIDKNICCNVKRLRGKKIIELIDRRFTYFVADLKPPYVFGD